MHLPSYDQIRDIHKKYASDESTFILVFTHCQIVWEIAKQLIEANKIAIDVPFVQVGCLLHDIGAYRLKVKNEPFGGGDYIRHGVIGYDILKKEGFDEGLCRIAERHTGVGITIEEIDRRHLPLPRKNYIAETKVERLVMYADKFHSKTPQFNSFAFCCERIRSFDTDNVEKFLALAEEFGKPGLDVLAKTYGMVIV